MRAFSSLLMVAILLSMLAGCDTTVVMTTSLVDRRAHAYYQANQYAVALKFANRLCHRKPRDFEAWALRCRIHLALGNLEQAMADAEYAWELMPDKLDSLRLRSAALSARGRHREAIDDLNTIIERSPRSAANQVALGDEYLWLGDFPEAIASYKLALSYHGEHAMAWNKLARVWAMAYQRQYLDGLNAKRFAARAVKLADTDTEKCLAWDTFGAALAQLGDFTYAQKAAKKALSYTEDPRMIRQIKDRLNGYKKKNPRG